MGIKRKSPGGGGAAAASAPPKKKAPSPQLICKEGLDADSSHCAPGDDPDNPPAGKGCTFKCCDSFSQHHGSYKYNGYHTILNETSKAAIYNVGFATDAIAAARVRLVAETDFGFSKNPAKGNYRAPVAREDPRSGGDWSLSGTTGGLKNYRDAAYVPFNHQYHHIMPWEAMYNAFDGAGGTNELAIVQGSGYNLNRGINVIILPMAEEYAAALQLPTHFSGHPAYNVSLSAMLMELKALLAPGTKSPHTITKQNAPQLKTCIENWEEAEFKKIVAFGKTLSPRTLKGGTKDKQWKGIAPDIRNCPLNDMMGGKVAGRVPI